MKEPSVKSPVRKADSPFRNVERFFDIPEQYPAELFSYPGITQTFYDSVPYHGKPTRVFACYGLPENAAPEHPVPGIVLIHGGGASALADWVELWNRRGYAAISMDTCGGIPCWAPNAYFAKWPRHPFSGPKGWGQSMYDVDLPPEDQWPYHAAAAVMLAHSLLRSLPGVDPERIGVTGVSWGGVTAATVAGLDPRFRFAIPVYGCGFMNEESSALNFEHPRMTPERCDRWYELWDPGHYLPNADLPLLFFSGSNDFAFPPDALQKSFDAVPNEGKRLSVRVAYPHGMTQCWNEETIFDFADSILAKRNVPELAKIEISGNEVAVPMKCDRKIRLAELNFTRATGYWQDRIWNRVPAQIENGRLIARIPRAASALYFNLFTENDCCYSSSILILQ